ncbi:MAG TPA: hypothetical protein DD723_07545 [Candidatus Omnitrophica bacterium]|nr:MAG: hypothetical protein A2Z81_09980 [Omnitrophica WOR_2 bacterium GWA2_45_18]HBR15379.1 hypothetical protein [Candidatus Omnitrophota bacterium]
MGLGRKRTRGFPLFWGIIGADKLLDKQLHLEYITPRFTKKYYQRLPKFNRFFPRMTYHKVFIIKILRVFLGIFLYIDAQR